MIECPPPLLQGAGSEGHLACSPLPGVPGAWAEYVGRQRQALSPLPSHVLNPDGQHRGAAPPSFIHRHHQAHTWCKCTQHFLLHLLKIHFIETYFAYNQMHPFKVYSVMSFDKVYSSVNVSVINYQKFRSHPKSQSLPLWLLSPKLCPF